MRVTVLCGGIGGARFLRGLLRACPQPDTEITAVVNTADDVWLFGLKICPDLDTVMYTLGDGIDEVRGWGRRDEGWRAKEELAAYGAEPAWFGLGDRDLATHVIRTQMLTAGYSLSAVTEALCERWRPGVRILPMSDDRVETHILIDDAQEPAGRRAVHFQEYWVGMRAGVPARSVAVVGIDDATPAPGVLDAIAGCDLCLLAPSNPVVSIGTVLAVPGVSDAVRGTAAPVVGLSPIIGNRPVRGMADALLPAVGVASTADAVAHHYGPRAAGGVLDGWLVDTADAYVVEELSRSGIACRAVPLLMHDVGATAAMATAALELARAVGR
ncbi:MAG TPA: 2-phospho-L-lactate transferase [Nocardioidaceae bacterium]|jgi:LPPG:FO 2-phospho-L-lactate transferase|nr:2-phospho-L-lactate transferase [Nocardioidaceae bacterium]